MAIGNRMLLFSDKDPKAVALNTSLADWGCMVSTCASVDELRGRIEGAEFDMVVIEPSNVVRKLIADTDPEAQLRLPLKEIERRHIQRVLAANNHNKTRSAKILGIDTKTLYNKLKSYQSADMVARKRASLHQGIATNVI